jgi:diguanylate cyclase (GGDEF)-like protein
MAARVIFDNAPFQSIVFSISTDILEKKITYSPSHHKDSIASLKKIACDKIQSRHVSAASINIPLPDSMGSIVVNFKKDQTHTLSDYQQSAVAIHFCQAIKNASELYKMRDLAIRDGLTGLLNRRFFDEILEHKIGTQETSPVSVLLIDLDNFKQVNDTHGHQAGDQVLKCFAQLLKESCRGTDIVARFGGEEFAVILPATTNETAHAVAQRLRKRLSNMLFTFDGNRLRITVSIGLATSISTNPILSSNVIKRADTALYQAKHNGKNQVCSHHADLDTEPMEQLGTLKFTSARHGTC